MKFEILFKDSALEEFLKLDKSIRIRIGKKIKQMERADLKTRHLRSGIPFFVLEVGQYRICFSINVARMEKTVYFIGNHKDYERWYKSDFR